MRAWCPITITYLLVFVLLLRRSLGQTSTSSTDSFFSMENLEELWDVWSTRILVALFIIAVWDWWQTPHCEENKMVVIDHPTTNILTYEPMQEKPGSEKSFAHPLLERLAEQGQDKSSQQHEYETDDSGKAPDECATPEPESKQSSDNAATKDTSKTKKRANEVLPTAPRVTASASLPPSMSSRSSKHPGMDGFAHWYDVETSLYRIYTLGRHDGVEVAPPYIPHSYRGKVSIFLHITNKTNQIINIFWVDYKGKHVPKGNIKPNQVWTQFTWIDHPWVFEGMDDQQNPTPFLYYIPYRVIPTLPECPTLCPSDPEVGQHKFALVSNDSSSTTTTTTESPCYYIQIQDEVMPFPGNRHFHSPLEGITWTLQHMSRLGMESEDPRISLLQKYLIKIVESPDVIKYRQLRIASPKFGSVWNSPMQGLLQAVGFVEVQGYAELGSSEPLCRERIQDLALLSYLLTRWQQQEAQRDLTSVSQPLGADGYGAARYGRVGA